VCRNGVGDETQLLSGDFGLPLWLGFQTATEPSGYLAVVLCYGTDGPNEPKPLGGLTHVTVKSDGSSVSGGSRSDSNGGIQANAEAAAQPTYTVTPGGTSGGQALTFEIPFALCSGVCYSAPGDGVATTGLILGTISQRPAPGGVSAAWTVDELCLMVNGIPVTGCHTDVFLPGATTTGNSPVNVGTGGDTPGPCVVGVCIPSIDYVGTSGQQLATLYLPQVGAVPVYGVRTCLFQGDAATPCPA
jgi:hypothetical protein